ncbi:VOC family protein [Taibaiella chishuiensis]|uniref:Putative enzyme related to lactoylglutathione lyase n=1 Tax=Taibaiella chishuiensis TaxID=1434707 RepID=A0A2P8D4N9_9BACT|nr:VOC family protein [Taibaiella chishuiensis]PSK92175.1 putative enzyme related to lactoylglutathione lyase [Taibaiella chishuiensis]
MRLNQVTVPALDLEVSVSFYTRLGMTLIVDALPGYARFACPDGSTFSLHRVDRLPQGDGIWIYFECDDLDAEVARLEAAGMAWETRPEDQSWLWREARLKDPDGNQLIFYFAGENRLNPPWRLSEAETAARATGALR